MSQSPSKSSTRYSALMRPKASDGYPQRIEIWDVLNELGEGNRAEVFRELLVRKHKRPKGAEMDENYVRIELTDMCKRGFISRVFD